MVMLVRFFPANSAWEPALRRAEHELIPRMVAMPGFRSQTLLRLDDGRGIGMLDYARLDQVEAALDLAMAWGRSHLADLQAELGLAEQHQARLLYGWRLVPPEPGRPHRLLRLHDPG